MQDSEQALRAELKELLVTTLRLEQVKPQDRGRGSALFTRQLAPP